MLSDQGAATKQLGKGPDSHANQCLFADLHSRRKSSISWQSLNLGLLAVFGCETFAFDIINFVAKSCGTMEITCMRNFFFRFPLYKDKGTPFGTAIFWTYLAHPNTDVTRENGFRHRSNRCRTCYRRICRMVSRSP